MKVQYLWENASIISKQTTHWSYTAAVYTSGCLRICWQTLVRIWNLCEGDFLENQALAIMSQSAIDVFHYVTPLYNYAATAQISHLALNLTISSEKCCWLTKPSQNKVSFVAFQELLSLSQDLPQHVCPVFMELYCISYKNHTSQTMFPTNHAHHHKLLSAKEVKITVIWSMRLSNKIWFSPQIMWSNQLSIQTIVFYCIFATI